MFDLTATVLMSIGLLFVTASVYQVCCHNNMKSIPVHHTNQFHVQDSNMRATIWSLTLYTVTADASWGGNAVCCYIFCGVPQAYLEQEQLHWNWMLPGRVLQ